MGDQIMNLFAPNNLPSFSYWLAPVTVPA